MNGSYRRYVILSLSLLVLLACGLSSRVDAQEKKGVPRLGEHTFVPNRLIRSPFVQSYIRSTTGIGTSSKVQVPLITLPDSTVLDLETSVTAATISFEFQYAIKDWVAVWGNMQIIGRLGTSTEALLSEGITGVGSFELGWLFKLWEDERNSLSLDLYSQRNQGTFINLLDWLSGIIEDGALLPGNTLVRSRDSMRGVGALNYAHAFSPLLGLTAGAGLGYGEKLNRSGDNTFSHEIGTGLSCNLAATTSVPLGLFLGYSFSNVTVAGDGRSDNVQTLDLRINYMGFDDFVVGLDMGVTSTPVKGLDESVKSSVVTFDLQYFF